ncbi:hypothetical protein ACWF9G_18990 [Nocardia sp. NPDC055029]
MSGKRSDTKEPDAVVKEEAESVGDTSTGVPAGNSRLSGWRSAAARGRSAGESAVKVKTLLVAALVAILLVAVGAMGWQAQSKANELDALQAESADRANAERIALDYAVAAADMDFKDMQGWQTRLTDGTSPELSNKLKQAAASMEQIIAPLQWTSKSEPIVARVRSVANDMYAVDCFVSVLTKNSQAPQGIQSTATYRLTIDKNRDWLITEVGGIESALSGK